MTWSFWTLSVRPEALSSNTGLAEESMSISESSTTTDCRYWCIQTGAGQSRKRLTLMSCLNALIKCWQPALISMSTLHTYRNVAIIRLSPKRLNYNATRYSRPMIASFRDRETERIWRGEISRKLPQYFQQVARRKLRMLK